MNSCEAESRRLARFSALGHSPGRVKIPEAEPIPDFPLKLDLHRTGPGATP